MKEFSWLSGIAVFLLLVLPAAGARGETGVLLFDQTPVDPSAAPPASMGQQPFVTTKDLDLTPSQSNNNQLNQLFAFETTPDICAAGEAYITGDFDFSKYPGSTKQFRYQLQGQYGITDQLAIGGFAPGISTKIKRTQTGIGDIDLYAQYKLDQFVNPEIVDLTVQVDLVLPTGNSSRMRDTGKFGVRPLLLAYKDFGQQGPGILGVYGLAGFTVTTNSDIRLAAAVTYQINQWVGIFEFYDQDGVHGHPFVELTPGLSYRGFGAWEFTVGVPVGVSKGTPDYGIAGKISYRFAN